MEKVKIVKKQETQETIYLCDFCKKELYGIGVSKNKKDFCDTLCQKLYNKSPKMLKQMFEKIVIQRHDILSDIRCEIQRVLEKII